MQPVCVNAKPAIFFFLLLTPGLKPGRLKDLIFKLITYEYFENKQRIQASINYIGTSLSFFNLTGNL